MKRSIATLGMLAIAGCGGEDPVMCAGGSGLYEQTVTRTGGTCREGLTVIPVGKSIYDADEPDPDPSPGCTRQIEESPNMCQRTTRVTCDDGSSALSVSRWSLDGASAMGTVEITIGTGCTMLYELSLRRL